MYSPLLLAIFTFFGAVQMSNKFNTSPVVNSIVAVGVPFLAGVIIRMVYAHGYKMPVLQSAFPVSGLVVFGAQFAASLFIFRKIRDEESIVSMMGWAIGGALVVVIAIPFIAQMVHFA